jgi:predicted nucleic acid-binding protein
MQKNIYPFEVVISDSSSLQNLTNIGKLDLLKDLYNNVSITTEILDEYNKKHKEKLPDWIQVKEVKDKGKVIELCKKYGEGESSAIVFALENPNTLIVIDDQKPKMLALGMGLPVIGSLGIIKQAVDKNIISKTEAHNLFDQLKNTGGWISDKLLSDIKYPILNIKEMNCYKHEIKEDKKIDFRGNEVNVKTMEIISEKGNICKFDCKDKKGNNIYILQRIKDGNTESWYFDKDFNKESAINFISSFNKSILMTNNKRHSNGRC